MKLKMFLANLFALLIYAIAFSQVKTTINYTTSNLNTSVCNIFNFVPQVSVGGLLHYPVCGGATFGVPNSTNTTKYIKLNGNSGSSYSTNFGTAYAIGYAFTQNFSYSVAVNAAKGVDGNSGNSTSNYPTVYVGLLKTLPDPNTTDPTDCGSVDENHWAILSTYPIIGSFSDNQDYNNVLPSFVAGNGYNYMFILVTSANNQGNVTALINSISITKSANLPLSPATVNIPCGSNTAQTFTVGNPNNITGIQSYTWNLGSANNGWLYNGSAAPQTITTTTNTLSLTPVCGSPQTNITAAATIGGVSFAANNASTVSVTAPALSITGNPSICSSQQYSITGLPCNASVNWSISPASGIVSSTSLTSPSITLTGTGSGYATLTANVTACGVAQPPLTFMVHAGNYTSADYTLYWNAITPQPYYCLNQNITFSLLGGGAGTNYNWTFPTGWSMVSSGTGYIILKSPPSTSYPPTGNVSVTFTEPCGSQVSKSFYVAYSSNYCGTPNSPYSISPNPASSTITISCISLQTYCNIAAVQITDLYGIIQSSQSWSYTNQQVQMPVGFLHNGTYIAKIYSGTQWFSNIFIVQH